MISCMLLPLRGAGRALCWIVRRQRASPYMDTQTSYDRVADEYVRRMFDELCGPT